MDDLIGRKVAVNKLRAEVKKVSDSLFEAEGSYSYCEMVEGISTCLDDIPSAQQEHKIGKWLKISPARIYECSVCGQNVMTSDIDCYKWCHGCGARMED